jgi:hypothetical protein
MSLLLGIGLAIALLVGAAIGVLLTCSRYGYIALRQRRYEAEAAQARQFLVVLAAQRRAWPAHPIPPADDEITAA